MDTGKRSIQSFKGSVNFWKIIVKIQLIWCITAYAFHRFCYFIKIKNVYKFGLNWPWKLQENNERKKRRCCIQLCAFICLMIGFMPDALLILYILWKLPLSLKLHYFKECRVLLGLSNYQRYTLPEGISLVITQKMYFVKSTGELLLL